MKKFVLICFCVLSSVGGYAQNWDINTLPVGGINLVHT